ncbi:MAG: serine/threonine-protein kinase [Blastocatellia bacterium]
MEANTLVGQILDNQYKIEALLGQGGMGAVYKARHVKLGDLVAIKVMPPHISSNPEHQKRFLREGQAARRFKHPNAITVFDLRETSDGMIYMVLEYIEGHNLREEINKKGIFTPKEALELIEPVANALNEAHAMGVVHRDIKPENIMVSRSNGKLMLKLLDLGIAKIIDEKTALTVEGQVLGTPYYMSPEQWGILSSTETQSGKSITIDGRADIYSLGVIVYEMVTGQRPFTGSTMQELAVKHITATPLVAKEINPNIPEAFSQAIARSIAKERENRPATCKEFIEKLEANLESKKSDTLPISEITDVLVNKDNFSTKPMGGSNDLPTRQEQLDNAKLLTTKKMDEPPLADTKPMSVSIDRSDKTVNTTVIEDKKGKTSYLVISLAIITTMVLLAVVFYNKQQQNNSTTNQTPSPTIEKPTPIAKVEEAEIMRYFVEVVTKDGKTLRKTKDIELSEGEQIQFHFQSKKPGYLYILMPGTDNKLTTILTTKPIAATGVTTNLLKENTEYIFPNGDQLLTLGKPASENKINILFSPNPIKSLAFLDKQAGYSLSTDEQKEFLSLLDRAIKPTMAETTGSESYRIINSKVNDDNHLAFDIDIKVN